MVLATGIVAVELGALFLIMGFMNRATGEERAKFQVLFLYIGGMILVALMGVALELTSRVYMHSAHFYRVVATIAPLVLAGVARTARFKWAATAVAGVYTAFWVLLVWVLPLFPAEPKLGPVLYPVAQFVPPEFPLLLIVPPFALDLLWQRTEHWGAWKQAVLSGIVFVLTFAASQWPFASFLMSAGARSVLFGTKYFDYNTNPLGRYPRFQFIPPDQPADFWREALLALVISVVLIRIGLYYGDRMRRAQR